MLEFLSVLFVLSIVLIIVAAVGHLLWLMGDAVLDAILRTQDPRVNSSLAGEPRCRICNGATTYGKDYCDHCRCLQSTALIDELAVTQRTVKRLYQSHKIRASVFAELKQCFDAEYVFLTTPQPAESKQPYSTVVRPEKMANAEGEEVEEGEAAQNGKWQTPSMEIFAPRSAPSVVTAYASVNSEAVPSFLSKSEEATPNHEPAEPEIKHPRRSFSDVLNSFMEESNIRWGEIIGGLLIIGCSTALVVSLWAQISEIPVLKFLIFTTVTAVLFGVGLYTEHRWKLPNTSLGILTIATLLVPLNFLAIAAVSSGSASGHLVLASEIIAPAIFLTLVYYAGRVITPGCASLLSSGILLSSIGQLLVRHFATSETTGFVLILLGGVPVLCFLTTVGLTLKALAAKRRMSELKARILFTMLGTMSFASALPFGLLLYKAGPLGMTMMYLAPIVTMWGLPLLLTGVVLWRQVREKERVATRTTGGTLAILGAMIAVAGVILSWPNPSSIVPSALITFLVFTAIAVALEVSVGHLVAALCLAVAYVVTFHVAAGNVPWTNLRVFSLLNAALSASTGAALVGVYSIFLIASEWLERQHRRIESAYYQVASGLVAFVGLALVTVYGVLPGTDHHYVWAVYLLYSVGAFWIAWRRQTQILTWTGSALMVFATAQLFANVLSLPFPWQTALIVNATVFAVAAVTFLNRDRAVVIWKPLYFSTLVSIFGAVICLFQGNPWQVTSMQAERVLWLAGIILALLWINRGRLLFVAFQIAVTSGVILTVKAALQATDWYAYLPHAFLHPTGLLIQATVLLFVGLAWITLRVVCRHAAEKHIESGKAQHWTTDAWRVMDSRFALDRFVSWSLLGAFLMLVVYGVASGITQELAAYGSDYNGYNLAGFPRQEVLGVDSWIVFALLLVTMLGHALERRRSAYILGAAVASTAVVPLVAGLFESQIAVASAWRWFTAFYLIAASLALWYRTRIIARLKTDNAQFTEHGEAVADRIRAIVIMFSVVSLFLLTAYPSLRAIYYLPVRGPASGVFSLLDIAFSYSVPFIIVAAVFVGHSIRERSTLFALTAGACLNGAVTIAYLLSVVAESGLMDRVVLVRVVQLNAITCSLFTLAWLKYRPRWESRLEAREREVARTASAIMVKIPVILNGLLLTQAVAALMLWPTELGVGVRAVGSFLGWLAWATAIVAFIVSKNRRQLTPANLFCLMTSFVFLLSFVLAEVNVEIMTGLHTLTVGMIASAWLLFAVSMISADTLQRFTSHAVEDLSKWKAGATRYAVLAAACGIAFALRPGLHDPAGDWWPIASLLALSGLFAVVHSETSKRKSLLVAFAVFNVAGAFWWLSYVSDSFQGITAYFLGTIIIVALSGLGCLLLELRLTRTRENLSLKGLAVHDLAALLSVFAMSVLIVTGLLFSSGESPLLYFRGLPWAALLSVVSLFVGCLYNERSRYAVIGIYIAGLFATGLIIQQTLLTSTQQFWLAAILLAVQALVTSALWRKRANVWEICKRFQIPLPAADSIAEARWLIILNTALVAAVGYLALTTILRAESLELRLTAAVAVIAQTVTFALLVEGEKRTRWQYAAIGMFLVGAVLLGWAWLTPLTETRWLNRSAIVAGEMSAAIALLAVWLNGARGRQSDWSAAVRRCIPWIVATAVAGMLVCLNVEVLDQLFDGSVATANTTVFAIGAIFVLSACMLIVASLSPELDPLALTERGRMIYVYSAEVLLMLLFVHVRLTMPWLFGSFERYWPFIVMLIAYAGVLVSEALRRQQLTVLARPLERTGTFLPLLPVLGFWIAESEVDYSALLVVTGGLYGLLSLLRRSFWFGVSAAVCANGALWYFLQRTDDYQFLQHPQLWLIPVALSVLLTTHLNEEDFTEDQLASTRYLSLVTIYLSSTADIVINGVSDSPWLPLVLGAFSLAGIFGGIILRVRGMLLLGSTFLLFAIVTMIWYASANLGWTWLWYVAGIVTGATIIFMFAVFEKRRSDVLRLVEGLKDWER